MDGEAKLWKVTVDKNVAITILLLQHLNPHVIITLKPAAVFKSIGTENA